MAVVKYLGENYSSCLISSDFTDFKIAIHGGAWDIPSFLRDGHREGVINAYLKATELLFKCARPIDAIVEALEVMEADPVFDAGYGSFLNEVGEVELDAAVMEGNNLNAGAVASLVGYNNPSRLALAVMEQSNSVLLVGEGASIFAKKHNFCSVNSRDLVVEREIKAWENWVNSGKPDAKIFFSNEFLNSSAGAFPDKRGTVGVVIGKREANGEYSLYAGTSTGGTPGKMVGRVGDVPLVGCGVYADNEGAAVSCTGWGEGLIRVAAAKTVSERVRCGMHPQEAVESVLGDLLRRTDGRGGIIAIDRFGRTGAAFSTPDMAFAGECVKHCI